MPSAVATKASDKITACKKLTTILQKEYGKSVPKLKLPVLETMLFAVCVEDNPWDLAEAGYEKLIKSYFDLNEIRVSSVSELERTLSPLRNADWKGLRIRSILRFVFESTYSYDFEKLARLTLESAQKRLKKIDYLSPFVSNFTLQQAMGSYVICLDDSSHRATIHLGIVPPDSTIDEAAEFLRAGVKKSEAFGFSHLLRCLATDPKLVDRFTDEYDEEGSFDVLKVAERLATVKAPKKKKKKVTPPPPAPKAAAPPKAAATKAAAAPAKKQSTTTPPKVDSKKSAAKKTAAAPAKKQSTTTPPKVDSKKTAAKKAASKRPTAPAKKQVASKSAARNPVKKSATAKPKSAKKKK